MSVTGSENTMAFAFVSIPAFCMTACMMAFLFSVFVTISTSSFSDTRETPKNFSALFMPVPLAWSTVPPAAPALLAASMTISLYPWFAITINNSCAVSFNTVSSPFSKSWLSSRNRSSLFPPMLLTGTIKAMPVPGMSILNCWRSPLFSVFQTLSVTMLSIMVFSVSSRPR